MKTRTFIFFLLISITHILFAQKNTEYARIPFEIDEYNRIIIRFDLDGLEVVFGLNAFGSECGFFAGGYEKFKNYIGETTDLKDAVREYCLKAKPGISAQDIEKIVNRALSGQVPIFKFDIKKDNYIWKNRRFCVSSVRDDGNIADGMIPLSFFGDVNNILINYTDKIIEINAPITHKKSNKLYTEDKDLYYIFGTLDGKKQAFLVAPGFRFNSVRKDTETDTIIRERNTNFTAKIKINGIQGTYEVLKYSDVLLGNDEVCEFLSSYNVLGYPFFKDRCIQFDFEHSTCYIW